MQLIKKPKYLVIEPGRIVMCHWEAIALFCTHKPRQKNIFKSHWINNMSMITTSNNSLGYAQYTLKIT